MPRSYDRLIAESSLPRLEARALMERAAHRSRTWLIAHGDEAVPDATGRAFDTLAQRRRAGEPLAYLIGAREFHGREFEVGPAVLIPREDTELLVDQALSHAPPGARVIDLGTGSGCIALTLACIREDLQLLATDASAQALELAHRNAQRLCPQALASGRLVLRPGDWWHATLPGEQFELALSNPPYIAAADPHLRQGDLRYEPAGALTDFDDGLAALRAVIAGAPAHLAAGGWLLLEHGWDQGAAVRALLLQAGFAEVFTATDAGDRERCSGGRLGARAAGDL